MTTIKDRVRVILSGNPIISSIIMRDWPLHGWTHEAGGIDEISVEDLEGLLADPQVAGWISSESYPIDLSTPPNSGETLVWDGSAWVPGSGAGVISVNSLQGDLVLLQSDGISITDNGSDTITITNTGVLSLSSNSNGEELTGDLRLVEGANVTITALADGYQIAAAGATAGVTSLSSNSNGEELTGDLRLVEGTNVTITALADGFTISSSAGGGVTDHGSLTGLDDEGDHLYAFLHDGTRPATGDFDMDQHAISDIQHLDFSINGSTRSSRRLRWDNDEGALLIDLAGVVDTMRLGQDLMYLATNDQGSTLNAFVCLTITGSTSDIPDVEMASYDARVFGIATQEMTNGETAYALQHGYLRGVNTSSYAVGAELWKNFVTGGITTSQPAAPNIATRLGTVITSDASDGIVYVDLFEVPSLSYLSDVAVRGATVGNGNVLEWDATNSYWNYVFASLDWAYDAGGSGDGRLITADAGAVLLSNTGENGVLEIRQTSASPATTDAVIEVVSQSEDLRAMNFVGDAGTNDKYTTGHRLWTNDAAITVGCRNVSDAAEAYVGTRQWTYSTYEAVSAVFCAKADTATYGALFFAETLTHTFQMLAEGDILLDADGYIFLWAVNQVQLDSYAEVRISSEQGTMSDPSMILSTHDSATPFYVVTERPRDFFLYQGAPEWSPPFHSFFSLSTSGDDPVYQNFHIGSVYNTVNYVEITASMGNSASGYLHLKTVTNGSGNATISLSSNTSDVGSITLDASSIILWDAVIGQRQSATVTQVSNAATIDLTEGNYQTWAVLANVTSITVTDPNTAWASGFTIRLYFDTGYWISSSAWPSDVHFMDGTDGALTASAGDYYILTLIYFNGVYEATITGPRDS